MGGVLGLFVLVLMGVDSCAPGGSSSPVGGGGGGNFEPPEDTGDDTGEENGGAPGPLADCDPEYEEVWVACSNKKDWLVHAEMNVAVSSINVRFAGTSEGNQITEVEAGTGVFEGTIPFATYWCDEPVSFEFQAFGTLLSTYECSYDYTP
jgi:hypothetical protein